MLLIFFRILRIFGKNNVFLPFLPFLFFKNSSRIIPWANVEPTDFRFHPWHHQITKWLMKCTNHQSLITKSNRLHQSPTCGYQISPIKITESKKSETFGFVRTTETIRRPPEPEVVTNILHRRSKEAFPLNCAANQTKAVYYFRPSYHRAGAAGRRAL